MSGQFLRAPLRWLMNVCSRIAANLRPRTQPVQKPVRHLRLMQLEDRRVLNASLTLGAGVELTGGEDLLVQDGGMQDVGNGQVQTVDLEISNGTWTVDGGISDTYYDISPDGKTLTVDQSVIDDGGLALDGSDALLIQGDDAATDNVELDLTGLDFVPSGGIIFAGGEDPGNGDNDSLEIRGYSLTEADGIADVTLTHTGMESGTVELTGIGTVEFSEIEPLTLDGDAADLVIQLPAGADDDVVLSDDSTPNDDVSQIASPTNNSFETTTFTNPTNSLTILDGSGAKTIKVEGLDSQYDADLTIDVDSDDTVLFQTNTLDINGGDLNVAAGQITATVDISTSATTAGSITLQADGDIETAALDASGTSSDGDVLVESASGAITQTSGVISGNMVTLNAAMGIGSTSAIQTSASSVAYSNTTSGNVRITDADAVTFSGSNSASGAETELQTTNGTLTTNNITQTNGDVSLTANGADNQVTVNATQTVNSGNGNITVIADRVDLAGNLTTAAGNIIIAPFSADEAIGIGGGAGDLNLDDGEISRLTTSGTITIGDTTSGTGAVDVDSVSFANNVTIAGGSISVNGLQSDGNTVQLIARTGAITDGGAGTDVSALTLDLTAAAGIGAADAIDTAVTNISFNNTSGQTRIANTGQLIVYAASDFGDGGIVSAGSPMTINADVTSAGDFTLSADGDAVGNDTDDDLTINANVTHTGLAGAAKSIILQADDDVRFDAGTVSFQNSNAGDVLTVSADSAAVTDADANNTGDVDFSGGTIDAGLGTAEFSTSTGVGGGAIVDTGGAGSDVTAATVTFTARSGIGSADAIDVSASTVSFTNTDNNVQITEADTATFSGTNNGSGSVHLITTFGNLTVGTADIVTQSGSVTLNAQEAGASVILLDGPADAATVSTIGGATPGAAVTIIADDLDIQTADAADATIDAGVGLVTLRPHDTTRAIDVGGAGGAGDLDITDAEIDRIISSGGLTIGSAAHTGNISTTAAISPANLTGGTLLFEVGGSATISILAAGSVDSPIATTFRTDSGNIILAGGSVTTSNDTITFDGTVRLDANTSVSSDTGAGDVVFTSTIDADLNTSDRSLMITAGTGAVDLQGDVGNSQALDNLTIVSSSSTSLQSVTTRSGGLDVTATTINLEGGTLDTTDEATAGAIALNGNVVLMTNVAIDTNATTDGSVTVTGTLNGAQSLTIDAGTASVEFQDEVGGSTALTSILITDAGDVDFLSAVNTDGNLTQTAGSGTTTFNGGTVGGNLDVSNSNVVFASGTLAVTGTADVAASSTISGGTDDSVADLTGTVITLSTGGGGIGTSGTRLDVIASTRLNASTSAAGADFFIDGIGNLNVGQVNAGTGTAALSATSAIVDAQAGEGAGNENIIADNAALRAADGIGTLDDIDVNVINLAFSNTTSNNVNVTDTTDGLTINSVDGLTMSSNTGGNITLVAASPVTFAVDMTAAGDILVQALESGTPDFDNITVNGGVTVESTAGDVTFEAGDRIIVSTGATVQADGANGDVTFDSGFGDTDNDGSMTLNGTVSANDTNGIVTLDLNGEGAATQSADGSITASGLQLNSLAATGSFDLDATTTNDVAVIAAGSGGAIEYRDADTLEVGTVTTAGVTTVNAGVTLCVITGNLALQRNISAGTGTVRLQTNGASSSITQDENNSTVTASALGAISGSGGIALDSATNNVDTFSASTTGALEFAEADGFTVGDVAASGCFTGTTGLTAGGDIELCLTTGNLSITSAINATGNTVRLQTGGGSITQTAAGIITADTLGARATLDVDLNTATNAVNTFAATSTSTGVVEFDDADGFTVGSVTAGSCFTAVTGVTTNSGSIDLSTSSGNLVVQETVTAGGTGDVLLTTTTSGDVQISRVEAAGDQITINAAGAITEISDGGDNDGTVDLLASTIQLTATSDIRGSSATDALDIDADSGAAEGLTATVNTNAGIIDVVDVDDLRVQSATTVDGDITIESGGAMSAAAVDAGGAHDVLLISGDSLMLDGAISAAGDSVLLVGNGNITQTAAGIITADELAVRQAADTGNIHLCHNNAVGEFAAVNVAEGGELAFQSTINLTIGAVAANTLGSNTFAAVTGVTTTNIAPAGTGNIFIVGQGTLFLDDAVNAGTADVRLLSSGSITQDAEGIITANELGVRQQSAAGDILLSQANAVDEFAASNAAAAGSVVFRSTRHLVIGEVETFTDACGNMFATTTGISTNAGDALVQAGGTLFVDEAINVGTADVRLIGSGTISQDAEGLITANELGVRQEAVSGNIVLCFGNAVDEFAADNAAESGTIDFESTRDLTIGALTAQASGTVTFAATNGVTATNGDIFIVGQGTLFLDEAINAGTADVRLLSSGSITQDAEGIITANELGVRQSSAAGNILLNQANAVDEFAASNVAAVGSVVFRSTRNLTIGEVGTVTDACGNMFATTTGISTNAGDALIQSDGSLFIDEAINVGAADVRLIGNGDIHQDAQGIITATNLGVRQQNSTFAMAGDLDANGDFDVHLCENNVVSGNVAIHNTESGGDILFHSTSAYAVGMVGMQTSGTITFAATSGMTTTDGDLLLTSAGTLNLTTAVNVGTGTIRIAANGDITQTAAGTITAAELAVRQQNAAAGDILLGDANAVSEFAAFNAFSSGQIVFNSTINTTIGSVAEFTDPCGNTFAETTGVVSTDGDILIQSLADLTLDEQINAGIADVRLIGNGNISQDAEGIITANELGVRQNSAAAGSIQLGFANAVDEFAAANAFDSGSVSFRSTRALTIGAVTASTVDGVAFAATTGVTTTNGDVLIDGDSTLFLDDAINAGTADVRLIGNGNITQDAGGVITANELGVRQEAVSGNIVLCFGNAVDEFAADNAAESGTIDFESTRDLTIGALTAQASGTVTFAATNGVTATNGDIFIVGQGTLFLDEAINAGTADVRLIGNGNITQDAEGIITASELGVRQQSGVSGNIDLSFANAVDEVAMNNAAGTASFRSTRNLTIGEVGTFTDACGNMFVTTTGIITPDQDVLVESGGTLFVDDAVNAGTGDVRLQSQGDITQDANGLITANELGVRQNNAAGGDIQLGFNNAIDEVAAANAFDTGMITVQSTRHLTVGSVMTQTVSGTSFAQTDGVVSTNGDITLESDMSLTLDHVVNAGSADVRLQSQGDITQDADGLITANELGVRQNSAAGGDIQLGFNNTINEIAAANAFDTGMITVQSTRALEVDSIDAKADGGISFVQTDGVVSTNGDITLESDMSLTLDHVVHAGTADVRLQSQGDITQDADGLITANELGVRQNSAAGGDIQLGFNNAIDEIAAANAFDTGMITVQSTRALEVDSIDAKADGGVSFVQTDGVVSTNGDITLESDMSLTLDHVVNAGTGDVRLQSQGDITQDADGLITANELGVRQNSAAGGDIQLGFNNAIDEFAAINEFDTGFITIHSVRDLNIDMVSAKTDGGITFAETNGITTSGGDVTVSSTQAVTSTATKDIVTTGEIANRDSGNVQITAGTDVGLAGAVDTSGFDNPGGAQNSDGGDVTIIATTGSVAVDDITTSGGDVATGVGGNAGIIILDAATTITLNDNPAVTDPTDGDLSSAGGTDLSTGIRTGDGADLIFMDPVILAANEPTDGETQTINTSGATAGDVIFQSTLDGATASANDLTINARDTDVSNPADPTSGDVTFMMDVGGTTRLGDLTIVDADDVLATNLIRTTSFTQLAGTGNTTLNEVNIETVTAGPSSAVDITTDYTINLRGNITVTDATGTVDNTTATGETIAITSVDGNVIIEDGVIVSTDEDPAPGHSSEFTGDSIAITADVTDDPGDLAGTTARRTYMAADRDSDADGINDDVDPDLDGDGIPDGDPADEAVPVKGLFKAGPDTELRTDGGVAKRFPPLLEPTGLITATVLNETDDQVFFRSEWEVETGVDGEENLRVNVDWRDPFDEPDAFPDTVSGNPVTSQRQQTFLVRDDPNGVNPAMETFGHVYSNADSVEFVRAEVPEYEVDFSVAHHESIVVMGSHLDQSPLSGPQAVPSGVITTTDDPATGTGIADPGTDVTDPIDSNLDLHFEFGLLEVRIPTEIGFVPPVDPERPTPAPEPAAVAPITDPPIQQYVPEEYLESATTSYSTQSEDYFQLRQNSTEPVEGFEHIDPDVGWKLLQPRRLKEWVYANDLDGSGYELWLITTKVKDGQDITFERPVLRFDVFDNQPFPGAEELLDQLPELKLKRLEFDEDGNLIEPETDASPDNPDDEQTGDPTQHSDSKSPQQSDSGDADLIPADSVARSTLTGLAVTAVLKRNRNHNRISDHLSSVSRILNRSGR